MKCHEEHHKKERYDMYREKMKIVDIPLFNSFNLDVKQDCNFFSKDSTHLLYAGSLDIEGRNPKYLCDAFIEISNRCNVKLHFYSRGNCENMIIKYQKRSQYRIVRHGYVDRDVLLKAISSADILISIGNKESEMIPSKIFEYIYTGKPIIHFYKSENDSSITYYKHYPKALLINENDDFLTNVNKISNFINTKQKKLSIDNLKELYIQNTPQYTVNFINEILQKK